MKNPAYPIPANANIAIAVTAVTVNLACLWAAANAPNWWIVALAAFVFSLSNNTVFSLHHEAVHGCFHPNRRINEAAGTLFSAFFPTIFSVQRISHFGHHRRNRTDEELYDCYLPGQSWALKTYWIYCLLTGFYWAIIPVAGLVYVLCPWAFRAKWFQQGPARLWGFEPFVRDIAKAPIRRVWLEGAFTLVFQIAMIWALGLTWWAWLGCYWAFGVNWSSVQYTDHAGSPRDVIEGAWNLKFLRITQAIFLNYNLHLAHHREPGLAWVHLPARVRSGDPNPWFWPIYLRLFLGARPAPEGRGPKPLDRPKWPEETKSAAPAGNVLAAALAAAMFASTLVVTSPSLAQTTGTPADHEALRKLRDEAITVVNNKDYALAERILYKPFLATVITQEAFTDFVKVKAYFESLYTRDFLKIQSIKMSADSDDYATIYTGTFAVANGSTKEHYVMADGREFDMNGRWTATTIKDGNDWKILSLHMGTNFLDNPVINAIEQWTKWLAVATGVGGLVLGFLLGWFLKRRKFA